jgi:hypothetical protein
MELEAVPAALRTRLGPEATVGLLELLETSQRDMRDSIVVVCTDRFERRLIEEVSGLRVQIAQVESSLRKEMADMGGTLRKEMADMCGALRKETADLGGALRGEMATSRVELLRWAFLFWVGQVLAIGGLMGVMLRLTH